MREEVEQALPVDLDAGRDAEAEVREDQGVEAVGIELGEREVDAQVAEDARNGAIATAVADVVQADVEVPASVLRPA